MSKTSNILNQNLSKGLYHLFIHQTREILRLPKNRAKVFSKAPKPFNMNSIIVANGEIIAQPNLEDEMKVEEWKNEIVGKSKKQFGDSNNVSFKSNSFDHHGFDFKQFHPTNHTIKVTHAFADVSHEKKTLYLGRCIELVEQEIDPLKGICTFEFD